MSLISVKRSQAGGLEVQRSQDGIPELPARPAEKGQRGAAGVRGVSGNQGWLGGRGWGAGQGQPLDIILGVQGAPEGISAPAAPRFKFLGRPPPASASSLLCSSELVASPDTSEVQ